MCKKIKELNGLTAEELLEKVGQSNVLPVDIAQMCYDLNIRVQSFNFDSIEKDSNIRQLVDSKGSILGSVLVKGDNLAILYRDKDSTNRKRFTIAHELGHCCLHMNPQEELHLEFRTDEISSEQKEIEANIFAGQLLIPQKSIQKLLGNIKKISKELIPVLAQIFMVSNHVMEARLRNLKIKICE